MNDRDAVAGTTLDYFNDWYDPRLARVEPVRHPQLAKRPAVQVGAANPRVTTKEGFLDLVRQGGGVEDDTDDPIEVTVVDIHQDRAAAVVRSAQYRDHLSLRRTPAGWRIVTAFWQLTDPYGEVRG